MKYYVLHLLLLLTFINIPNSEAQDPCNDTLNLYLNTFGEVELDFDDFTVDTSVIDSINPSRSKFECMDIGLQMVASEIILNDGSSTFCLIPIRVQDNTAPILRMDQRVTKYILPNDTLQLNKNNLSLSYFDNCGIDTIIFMPDRVDTSHQADSLVNISAVDIHGNFRSINFRLMIEIANCDSPEFRCKHIYRPNLKYGEFQVNASNFISERIINCDFTYAISWRDESGNTLQIPDNILTQDEVGKTLFAEVQNLTLGESCVVQVIPENCFPFIEELISWPEDLNLNFSCLNDTPPDLEFLSPEIMEDELGLDPQYFTIRHDSVCEENATIAYNYEDFIIESDTLIKILRRWTILDWLSNQTYDHIQVIKVYPGPVQFDELSCRNETTLEIRHAPFRTIQAKDVINDNGILICDSIELSFLDMDQNPIQLPGNRIYTDYEDPFLYVISHSLNGQESCTTKVNLEFGPIYCWEKFYICDELPRGQIFNNCDSGYSSGDHVEWPKDIEVFVNDSTDEALPEYLSSHGNVSMEDTYPTIVLEGCTPIHVQLVYQDSFFDPNTNSFPKELIRTWKVGVGPEENETSFQSWSYDQKITISGASLDRDIFRVNSASGQPLPGVQIADGFISDQNGEISLQNYSSDSILPVFSGATGINDISIHDLQILHQAIENERYLNSLERIAADANFDGIVDHDDLLILHDYLFNGIPLPRDWVFINMDFALEQMESHLGVSPFVENVTFEAGRLAYEYIGIRIGDIDFSVPDVPVDHGDTLTLEYEDRAFVRDEIFEVPVSMVEDIPLISLQFTLTIDPDKLDFLSVEPMGIEGLDGSNYNLIHDSLLRFSWNETSLIDIQEGRKAPADLKPMFLIRCRALSDGELCESLQFGHGPLPREVVYLDQFFQDKRATFITNCEGELNSSNFAFEGNEFTLFPNPSSDVLHLQWKSPMNTKLRYTIRDLQGRAIRSGWIGQSDKISVHQLEEGLYLLEVISEGHTAVSRKFMVLK